MSEINVVLIVCDTLRADHLGCYGYFRETSPNIDKIAEEGVLFEEYYNSGVPTGPGFTSIFTGLYPIHHKFYKFNAPNIRQVDDSIFTIPEIMQQMGYTTVALDNLISMLSKAKHYVRGYEYYINSSRTTGFSGVRAQEVNKRLKVWLKNYSNELFYLFIHYWDPHIPYNQPAEYRTLFHHEKGSLKDLEVKESPAGYKYVPGWGEITQIPETEEKFRTRRLDVDTYDGEIAYMDNAIGEVVSMLENEGVLKDTLVIVTADHGEELGQHYGIWTHGSLHSPVTHIPLIMQFPKSLPHGTRIKGFCQQIDILPTILEVLKVESIIPEEILKLDGKNLLPMLNNQEIRDKIFIEASSGTRAIQNKDWLLICDEWTKRPHREIELYKIREDPMEIKNLAKENPEKTNELKEMLVKWVQDNLKGGELDPAIYDSHPIYSSNIQEYLHLRRRLREILRT